MLVRVEQKWPSQLVIVRHGQSERNAAKDAAKSAGRAYINKTGLRDVDTPLTELGREQAQATGEFLASRFKFDAAFMSPYKRTIETTDGILQAFAKQPLIVQEERIREIEFGVLDGYTWSGVRQKFPEEFARRQREGKYWYRPPGGESRPDV